MILFFNKSILSLKIRKTIHVLESKTPVMISGIVGSATSAHMSFITSRFIHILYPSHLIKRQAVSMVVPLNQTISASLSYKGIRIVAGPEADEAAETEDHFQGGECISWQPNVG
jgi:hypothetical protein